MIGNYFFRAGFSRRFKRNALLRPWSVHHSRLTVLKVSERVRNHISHTVYHFYGKRTDSVKSYLHRVVGNKFRLGRHYGSSCGRLRHFILRALFVIIVFNIRKNECFHKLFYKCGLPRSYGTDNPYINISARSLRYILVNAHFKSSRFGFIQCNYIEDLSDL